MNRTIIFLSVILLFSGCSKHKKEKTGSEPVPVITLDLPSNQLKNEKIYFYFQSNSFPVFL